VSLSRRMFIIACILFAGSASTPLLRASGQTESPDTRRILDHIGANRSKQTPADRAAARRLNSAGDRAYRRHHYGAAFTAYMNSYPNAPNAYAYIMAGDSHWRDIAQPRIQPSSQAPAQTPPSCRLDNHYFAHDLALDVAQNQAVGLALAAHDDMHDHGAHNHDVQEKALRIIDPLFYKRAQESTACLQAMAQHYETEPPSSCVDLEQLRKCLGAPLIK
jgi:hypothetical protein